MLVLLPVAILILTGLAVVGMQRAKIKIGYIWLASLAGSVAAWIMLLVVNWDTVSPFTTAFGNLPGSTAYPIVFDLDRFSWPYAFSLTGLLVTVLLTAAIRFQKQSNPAAWAFALLITAAGLLAVLATTPLAIILTWTAVDLAEVAVLVLSERDKSLNQRTILAFIARIGGIILVLWAIISTRVSGSVLEITNAAPPQSMILLLACSLRLGVIPLHLPFTSELMTRRGLGTILRLVPPAASLVILGRLPAAVISPSYAVPVLLLCTIAAGYGAMMWLSSKDDLEGRPFWMIALSGLAIAASVRGQPESVPAWGVAMIIVGGVVFLFSESRKSFLPIPIAALLGLSGLPFTPLASGLPGISVYPFNLPDIFFIMVFGILLAGTYRQLMAKRQSGEVLERWMLAVYIFGLVFLLLCHWIIGLFGMPTGLQAGIWWVALGADLIAVIVVFAIQWWEKSKLGVFLQNDPHLKTGRKVWNIFVAVFNFDWLYFALGWILGILQRLVLFIIRLLEGEGGVLWTLLLIILLATYVMSGGSK